MCHERSASGAMLRGIIIRVCTKRIYYPRTFHLAEGGQGGEAPTTERRPIKVVEVSNKGQAWQLVVGILDRVMSTELMMKAVAQWAERAVSWWSGWGQGVQGAWGLLQEERSGRDAQSVNNVMFKAKFAFWS